ncbi:MAG: NTP transferase domain-containing protein [Desulfovibrio sp.]|nr:NTP transferase domain-containing protein [Desulfovibrio sp.]
MDKEEFTILRYISELGGLPTPTQIAEYTKTPLSHVAQLIETLKQRGKLNEAGGIAPEGLESLEPYRVKNAIILSAGLGKRFMPVSWERPKGLLSVKGDILIERLIEQLRDAGIREIIVVVGAMIEKFLYLREKYNVKFVINNEYSIKNTHSSVYYAKEYLGNSYIICSDNYYPRNMFHQYEYRAFYCSIFKPGTHETERGLVLDAEQRIISTDKPSCDQWVMYGHAYLDHPFASKFIPFMTKFWNQPGVEDMYWETIWAKDIDLLRLWALPCDPADILEFDSMAELNAFDPCFLNNNKVNIFKNICNVLNCKIEDIQQIEPINKGLTNHKFKFRLNGESYIYRHSSINSKLLIDRKREWAVLQETKKNGLSHSLIYMDAEEGWMISKFINETETFKPSESRHIGLLVQKLKILHDNNICSGFEYDYKKESDRILGLLKKLDYEKYKIAVHETEFMLPVFEFLDNDKWQICLCHNDIYADNILIENDRLELIDWEYGGDSDIGFDICKLFSMSDVPLEDIDKLLFPYYGRMTTIEEKKHLFACSAVCYYYWFVWGLYKSALNHVEMKNVPVWYEKMANYRKMVLEQPDRSER